MSAQFMVCYHGDAMTSTVHVAEVLTGNRPAQSQCLCVCAVKHEGQQC